MTDAKRPGDDERKEHGDGMQAAAEQEDKVVQFGGRIPASLRRRARMCAAAQDIDAQTLLRQALEEYLAKRNF